MIIDGITITASGFSPSRDELKNYVAYVRELVPNVIKIDAALGEDGCVYLKYFAKDDPFERIRRITGYLTGDLTTWNDSKQSEEKDRVKHI